MGSLVDAISSLEADILVGIASVLVAAIVPFLSVRAAQRLIRRDAKRAQMTEAFLGLYRHIQGLSYSVAFLREMKDRLDQFGPEDALPDEFHQVRFAQVRESGDHAIELERDCLMLSLIFGAEAKPLNDKIRELSRRTASFTGGSDPNPPPPDECRDYMQRAVNEITAEMTLLWNKYGN